MRNGLKKFISLVLVAVCIMCSCWFFFGCSCSGLIVLTENEIIDLWMKNTVKLRSYDKEDRKKTEINATGVIFGFEESPEDDSVYPFIVTNKHAVASYGQVRNTIEVTMPGAEAPVTAEAVAYNAYHDIAVLKVNTPVKKDFYNLFDASEYNLFLGSFFAGVTDGEPLYSFGNERGEGIVHYSGKCSNTKLLIYTDFIDKPSSSSYKAVPVIATSAKIPAGMSGGPLVNSHGQIVGIGTYEGEETDDGYAAYAVDINVVLDIYADAVTFGETGELKLFGYDDGTEYETYLDSGNQEKPMHVLASETGKLSELGFNGIKANDGLVISDRGSFFNKEGFDQIVKVDNRDFTSYSTLLYILYEYEIVPSDNPAKAVTVSVRNNSSGTIKKTEWATENYKVVKKTAKQQN